MDKYPSREGSQAESLPEPKRRKRWPTVVAVLLVLVVIAGIILYERHVGRFKRSEPYRKALALIQKDAKAIEHLGEPINDATWIPSAPEYDDTRATFLLKVSGPKGKADVRVQARRIEGKWEVPLLELTLAGGTRVPIDTTSAGGSQAPKFQPGKGSGGVEPPKPKLPSAPPGKPGAGPAKESAAPGPSLKIDLPEDLK